MILNKILLGIDDNWSTVEKVRYIHNKMCKEIRYDARFSYSSNPRCLEEIYYKDVSIDEDIEPELVCNTANKLFVQLMDRLSIKNKLIYKKAVKERCIELEDVACLFYDENGDEYYTNIIGDIENCRYNLKTVFFGNNKNDYEEAQNVKTIPQEELYRIDKKVGNIKEDYSDIVYELLKNEVKNTSCFKNFLESKGIDSKKLTRIQVLQYKMQFLNDYIKFRDKTAGFFERKRFYINLFNSTLDKFEKKNLETFEYIKENDDNNIDVILLIGINLQIDPVYFYYSEDTQSYVSIRKEDLQNILKGYKSARKDKDILNPNRNSTNTIENMEGMMK